MLAARSHPFVCLALACAALAAPVAGQDQTYVINGTVVDEATQRPLASVSVTVSGTQFGTLSDQSGRFSLQARLAPGTYTLSYSLIGRGGATQEVTLGSERAVEVPQVALRESAVTLEGIVVTGTGAPTQRRALGNSVAVVGGPEITQAKAVTIDAALAGKIPGAQITANSGTPGGGVSVRLRGTSSITGGAEPLYIVDGVIVDNGSDQQINFGYRSNPSNRLSDLNPNDIERIEVLKGAAAAALYGSRANNGVVQIFTKRGAAGRPVITVESRATLSQLGSELPWNMAPTDLDGTTPVERFNHEDLIFRDAWGSDTYVSVSGGADQTRYFLSGGYTVDNGVMINSDNERTSVRLNIEQGLWDWLTLSGGANYVRSNSNLVINGEQGRGGLLTSIVFTPTTVDFSERDPVTGEFVVRATTFPNPLEVAERWLTPQEVSRFVGSFQARANPLPDLTLEYRLGYDTYNMQTRLFIPRGTPAQPLGESNDVARSQYLINNDLIANYRFGIGESVDLTTSVGVNHTYTNEETVNALVTDLPLFVDLARGANQSVSQSRFETATLGYFVQQQIGFADRFFLTGALRFDASSTFGEDERWQLFPKLSGSWVVSEESFFADGALGNLFSSFRLRGAFGYAGNQPPVGSAYARFPRYQNTINIDRTGLTHLGNPGNPALKPERQREWEAGFDASVLDDRVGIAFTYYDQHIEDLLLSRVFAPSTGYTSILDNVGVMTNKGVELQLTGVIMDRPGFGWNATMNYSRNRNKVVELAGGDFTVGYLNRVAEGKPLGIFFGSGYERDANGNVVYDEIGPVRAATSQYIGDPNPDWQGSLLNEFRIGRNVRINFLLDGMFGHDMWNQTVRIMDTFAAGPLAEKVSRGEISQDTRARIQGMFEPYVEDATYVKLRQLTLTYDISDWAGRLGLSNASVEVGGRNLYTWTDYTGYDPEINMFGTNTVERGVDFAVYPNPRQFTFGVRMSY